MVCLELALAFVGVLTAISAVVANNPPKLEIQPNGQPVYREVGSTLALTCKPNVENPNLITQLEWRDSKNRRIESNRGAPIYVENSPGEPGLVAIFQKLTEDQEGNYTCSAYYASTEHIQSSVVVDTFVGITFVDAPESQFPTVGKDFTIKCKVQGNPAPSITWYKGDDIITSQGRYVVDSEGLLIKNVQVSDDGVYRCRAFLLSNGDMQTKSIKVEVVVPPVITPMKDISVIEGQTASVKCSATGKPPPTYKWIKLKEREDLSKTARFDVKQNTGDLIISKVEFYDDDYYKCVAENRANFTESTVKINVLVKPKIFEFLNATSPTNTQVKLVCKARGRPTPNITFRKLSSKEPFLPGQQPNDKRIIVEQERFEDKGETFGTLVITRLERPDDGLYECIAENSADTSYKNGHITVEFAPTFERTRKFPPAWAWEQRPGNISCIPEAIPNATIIWKWNNAEVGTTNTIKKKGNGPVSNLIVTPGTDNRFYGFFECVASNKHGTNSIKLKLNHGVRPGHVQDVKPQVITATSIKFNILPPQYFDGLPLKSITVQYRREQERTWDYGRNFTWSFHDPSAPYTLENLIPETTYHFRFMARNEVGEGPWTEASTITMPRRSEPAEPKILTPQHNVQDENSSQRQDVIAVSPYADHFEFRWNVPNNNGDPIDSYFIRYCVIEKINGEWRDSDCSEQIRLSMQYTSYELNALRPDTMYKIELRAHNAIGQSSPAQIKVKTAKGIDPAVPYNEPVVTNGAIIGMVVGAVILVLFVVDIVCFCTLRLGLLAAACNRKAKHHEEEDPKLGREEREPLKPDSMPFNGERNMSVEYDGKHVYSKSGEIIGKHSAV